MMRTVPVVTQYGVIYGRNALINKGHNINFTPFTVTLTCSLSLRACIPEIRNVPDVEVTLKFIKIKKICIYKIDDYPYEKYSSSSFDKVDGEDTRYALTTYDHVFDITGELESFL
jgi:hypothetical protein